MNNLHQEIEILEDLIDDLETNIEDLQHQLAFYHDNQIDDPETIQEIEAEIKCLSLSFYENLDHLEELQEQVERDRGA